MTQATTHTTPHKSRIPQLRFKEFKGEWVLKKLGDFLEITSSARVHKNEWTDNGIPFFRSSDVVAEFKGTENKKAYISSELYESLSKKIGRVKKDDLLVTGGGSIGIPFLKKNDDPLYFKDADLLWLKSAEEVSGYFLYSYLNTQLFRKYIKSVSHIGTIAHYTVIQAKNTPCTLPTLPEQQKIAAFLSAVDEKIQQLTQKKTILEQYKKGVMQQLFRSAGSGQVSGALRFKDEDGNDYPEWEEKRLGELCKSIKSGKSKIVDEGVIPLYGSTGIIGQCLEASHMGKHVLIARVGANAGKINLIDDNFGVSDNTLILKCTVSLEYEYIFYFLDHYNLNRLIFGSGQPLITGGLLKALKLNLPSLKEQQKIATYLSSIDKKIEQVNDKIIQTQTFKRGLLQKMFV